MEHYKLSELKRKLNHHTTPDTSQKLRPGNTSEVTIIYPMLGYQRVKNDLPSRLQNKSTAAWLCHWPRNHAECYGVASAVELCATKRTSDERRIESIGLSTASCTLSTLSPACSRKEPNLCKQHAAREQGRGSQTRTLDVTGPGITFTNAPRTLLLTRPLLHPRVTYDGQLGRHRPMDKTCKNFKYPL